MQQKTYSVDQDMPLDTLIFLPASYGWIDAGPFFGAFHALAVDHAGGRTCLTAGAAQHRMQRVMDLLNSAS